MPRQLAPSTQAPAGAASHSSPPTIGSTSTAPTRRANRLASSSSAQTPSENSASAPLDHQPHTRPKSAKGSLHRGSVFAVPASKDTTRATTSSYVSSPSPTRSRSSRDLAPGNHSTNVTTPPRSTVASPVRPSKSHTTATEDYRVTTTEPPMAGHKDLDELQAILKKELGHLHSQPATEGFHQTAFTDVCVDADIDSFLRGSSLYNNQKQNWTSLEAFITTEGFKKNSIHEEQLYIPLEGIFQEVLSHFGLDDTRQVAATHNTKLPHHSKHGEKTLRSSPDFLILGRKGKFFPNESFSKPSYADCVSPIEVKTESGYSFNENKYQVAVYAR